jgi:hypothetical protein
VLPRDTSRASPTQLHADRYNGTALALFSVMLLFWATLLGAELRVLRGFTSQLLQGPPSATAAAADAASGATSLEAASEELAVAGSALRTFGWAQIAAGLGATAALIHLLARRSGSWLAVSAIAVASILTSSHLFSVARAELSAFEQGASFSSTTSSAKLRRGAD